MKKLLTVFLFMFAFVVPSFGAAANDEKPKAVFAILARVWSQNFEENFLKYFSGDSVIKFVTQKTLDDFCSEFKKCPRGVVSTTMHYQDGRRYVYVVLGDLDPLLVTSDIVHELEHYDNPELPYFIQETRARKAQASMLATLFGEQWLSETVAIAERKCGYIVLGGKPYRILTEEGLSLVYQRIEHNFRRLERSRTHDEILKNIFFSALNPDIKSALEAIGRERL